MEHVMQIRQETEADIMGISQVHLAAFPTAEEANLVDRLREQGHLTISLIAEEEDLILGHIALSPVTVDGQPGGLGLAPVAVLPDYQNQGIGSALIQAGLDKAQEMGVGFVIVMGHRSFYPRFGFQQASLWNLQNEYDANDSFMALELLPNSIPKEGGLVRYGDEFAAFS